MKFIKTTGMMIVVVILLNGCIADMRTAALKREGTSPDNEKKGRDILENAWTKQGFDNLSKHKTYSLNANDIWKGLLGKMGKPWPDSKSELSLKFEVGTFNSQISFLDGKRQGESSGLQNWQYYEIKGGKTEYVKTNKRINFALPAYHYFFEMIDRLKKASIVRYAGQKAFRGEKYDLVFCTWDKEEPHMEHDQYMVWINHETGMLEFAEYSLRDNYLKIPGYKSFYGALEFKNFKKIDGILIPHEQTIYINGVKKKKSKHVHQLVVSDFEFDNFNVQELYPKNNSPQGKDSK